MKVSETGEFGLINLLAEIINSPTARQKLIVGIGDDAAAWQSGANITLATTDVLINGVHFTPETTSWRDLGWKTLAVSLSDIAAMGGIPLYALICLSLPGDTEIEIVSELYKGIAESAREFGVVIAGGDTNSAPVISISATVFGEATGQADSILTRATAKAGDRIAVTGVFGGAAGGLKMLAGKMHFKERDAAALKQAFCHPIPRISEGQILSRQGARTAIDISDGLLADLGHICRQSGVGAIINTDLVPVHPAVISNFGSSALDMALSGGEDYELLFTANESIIKKIKRITSSPITVIGEITGDTGNISLVDKTGKPYLPTETGWQHFKQ